MISKLRHVAPSDLKPRRAYLMFVETSRAYGELINLIREQRLARLKIIASNAPQYKALVDALGVANLGHVEVVPFATVNQTIDEDLYFSSHLLAGHLSQTLLNALSKLDSERFATRYSYSLAVAMTDRISILRRPFHALAAQMLAEPSIPLVVFGSSKQFLGSIAQALSEPLLRRTYVIGEAPPTDLRVDVVPAKVPRLLSLNVVTPAQLARHTGEPHVLFLSNLKDKQYRFVCEQIVPALARRDKVVLLTHIPEVADAPLTEPLANAVSAGRLSVIHPTPLPPPDLAAREMDCIAKCMTGIANAPPQGAPIQGLNNLTSIALAGMYRHIPPILSAIGATAGGLMAAMQQTRSLVVSPGRYLMANVMTTCANEGRIPTFEVQGGIIAKSQRFVPPIATSVLAMEPASAVIYTDFLNMPHDAVSIVGSARIDQSTKAIKAETQAQSRLDLDIKLRRPDCLYMFASQPMGVEKSLVMIRMLRAAILQSSRRHLIIKMHPNEGAEYAESYAAELKGVAPNRIRVISDGDGLKYANAADAVLTHYSTVGLEAFVLNKPVLVLNPFGKPLPIDLNALGVALRADTETEISACFAEMERNDFSQSYVRDSKLALLKDGRSTDRIVDLVFGARFRLGSVR